MVQLIQATFECQKLSEEMLWHVIVLIPKANGTQEGIGLLETVWKICNGIMIDRLKKQSVSTMQWFPSKKRGTYSIFGDESKNGSHSTKQRPSIPDVHKPTKGI